MQEKVLFSFARMMVLVFTLLLLIASKNIITVQGQTEVNQNYYVFLPIIVGSKQYQNLPQSPVEILSNYTYYKDEYSGSIFIYGEVVNHTDELIDVTIPIDVFDSSGDFIRTVERSVFAPLSPSYTENNKTCFAISLFKELRADPDFASFQFHKPNYKKQDLIHYNAPGELVITDQVLYEDWVIEGHIKNTGHVSFIDAFVVATYYDVAGKVVDCSDNHLFINIRFEHGDVGTFSVEPHTWFEVERSSYRLQTYGWWLE